MSRGKNRIPKRDVRSESGYVGAIRIRLGGAIIGLGMPR